METNAHARAIFPRPRTPLFLGLAPTLGVLAALALAGCGEIKPTTGDANVDRGSSLDRPPEHAPDVQPEAMPGDVPAEAAQPDAAADVAAEATPDTSPEAPADAVADASPEAPADVAAEKPVDAASDAPAEASPDGAADLATADGGVDANGSGDVGDAGGDACLACGQRSSVSVNGRHLLLDRKGNRLFTTVGGTAGANANSLVVIDVATKQLKHSIPIGSEPSSLAISDDGTMLWVGIDGASAVRRVDLTTEPPTPGTSFTLPAGSIPGYATVAGPMYVLWGTTTTVAVSMHYPGLSPSLAGVAIFDDGVARIERAPSHTGASRLVRGEQGWLFGYNNLHTGFGFYTLPVTASGVTQTEFGGLIEGFSSDIVYGGGHVYATTGHVVDVTTPTAPTRVGVFQFSGPIVPVPAKKRAWMVSPGASNGKARLRLLHTDQIIQLDSVELGDVDEGTIVDLVQPSDTLLAFLAIGGTGTRVVFVPTAPLP